MTTVHATTGIDLSIKIERDVVHTVCDTNSLCTPIEMHVTQHHHILLKNVQSIIFYTQVCPNHHILDIHAYIGLLFLSNNKWPKHHILKLSIVVYVQPPRRLLMVHLQRIGEVGVVLVKISFQVQQVLPRYGQVFVLFVYSIFSSSCMFSKFVQAIKGHIFKQLLLVNWHMHVQTIFSYAAWAIFTIQTRYDVELTFPRQQARCFHN